MDDRPIRPLHPVDAIRAGFACPEGAIAMIRENPVAPGCARWLVQREGSFFLVDSENVPGGSKATVAEDDPACIDIVITLEANELMVTPCSDRLMRRIFEAMPSDGSDPSDSLTRLGEALSAIDDLA